MFILLLEGVVSEVKKVQIFIVLALLAAVVCSALPAVAWDPNKQHNLGLDNVNMQWWILDYGTNADKTHFSVVRKYYTNEKIKQDTVEVLMSKFGYSPEVAGSLYFTEYGFVYTANGAQFATTYVRHYDMLGHMIHGTNYDDSSEETKRTFSAVVPNHASGKALALALKK